MSESGKVATETAETTAAASHVFAVAMFAVSDEPAFRAFDFAISHVVRIYADEFMLADGGLRRCISMLNGTKSYAADLTDDRQFSGSAIDCFDTSSLSMRTADF